MSSLVFFENFTGASIVLSKIQPHHAEAFIAHRIRIGSRTTTVNKDIRVLKCTFNLAIELRCYLAGSQNPFGKIKQRQIIGNWNPQSEIINNLYKNFQITNCRAGVAKCTLHDLRRSAITNGAQLLTIQVVQQLAGHSDISTTIEYYLIVRREDLEYANKVLNSILAKAQDD